MAFYEYEHLKKACKLGKVFDWEQSIKDDPLDKCPECGGPVKKLISMVSINTPTTESGYKEQGFTKLVRRDKGVYENVTAREGESKVVNLADQSTYPIQAGGPKKK